MTSCTNDGKGSIANYVDALNWKQEELTYTSDGLNIGKHQVMQYWERPIMRQLALFATRRKGRVLEIGFGLGISANYIMDFGCDEYCVIEAHPAIAEKARTWGKQQSVPVTVIEDFWQNAICCLGRFDGILFDTFPLRTEERSKNHFPFLPIAKTVLSKSGCLAYYSDETRSFRPDHLKIILDNFNNVEFCVIESLEVPRTCEYWSADHMVIPCVSSPRINK
jgi:guanidinoacetate N-methyltransferase